MSGVVEKNLEAYWEIFRLVKEAHPEPASLKDLHITGRLSKNRRVPKYLVKNHFVMSLPRSQGWVLARRGRSVKCKEDLIL